MYSNYPGIKLEPALERETDKIEHCYHMLKSSTQLKKQVISRRGKNENVFEMSKNE